MGDMLVKLYELPPLEPALSGLRAHGLAVRRADPCEKHAVAGWVREHFEALWALECEVALEQRPVTCFVAVEKQPAPAVRAGPYDLPPERLVGFGCYDVSARGMFGPLGVHEAHRGHGVGTALLLACLHAMKAERYAYAVIGWVGPAEFYARAVGAIPIEGSEPGIYHGRLEGVKTAGAEPLQEGGETRSSLTGAILPGAGSCPSRPPEVY